MAPNLITLNAALGACGQATMWAAALGRRARGGFGRHTLVSISLDHVMLDYIGCWIMLDIALDCIMLGYITLPRLHYATLHYTVLHYRHSLDAIAGGAENMGRSCVSCVALPSKRCTYGNPSAAGVRGGVHQ